ncbi:uncharacterized protein LOC106164436 [Lingula anatina]|uniref:Uncharacterized protein LOC106164436 n=1 Tax=Lingula anatina TaxID=7574 RepID=A0A1S3IHU4_LINAN|nr:uncharacterized protein LOC106164436 [Lingula anatina]|eukprot:XP_013397787.1 uncharacterized protein LOC106164436 [Lingula anatina]
MPKTPKTGFKVPRKSSHNVINVATSHNPCILDELDTSPALPRLGDTQQRTKKTNKTNTKNKASWTCKSCPTYDTVHVTQKLPEDSYQHSPQEAKTAPDLEASSIRDELVDPTVVVSHKENILKSTLITSAVGLDCATAKADKKTSSQKNNLNPDMYTFKLSPEAKKRCEIMSSTTRKSRIALQKQIKARQNVLNCISRMSEEIHSLREKQVKISQSGKEEKMGTDIRTRKLDTSRTRNRLTSILHQSAKGKGAPKRSLHRKQHVYV